MKVARVIRQSLVLVAIAGASAAIAGTAAASSASNVVTTNNQNTTSQSSDIVSDNQSNVQVVVGQNPTSTVTQTNQAKTNSQGNGDGSANDGLPTPPSSTEPNQPSNSAVAADTGGSDLPTAPTATTNVLSASPESLTGPTADGAAGNPLSLPVHRQIMAWYGDSSIRSIVATAPAVVATAGTVPPLNPAAAAHHSAPAVPVGLLTRVTDLLDSLTLPAQALVGAILTGLASAFAWPLLLKLGLVILLVGVGYVALLRRSGFATAPRGSGTHYYFVTPSSYELCPAVIRTG